MKRIKISMNTLSHIRRFAMFLGALSISMLIFTKWGEWLAENGHHVAPYFLIGWFAASFAPMPKEESE